MIKMEWSRLAVESLIDAYKEETCLYNIKAPLYHNKHARKEALDRIACALNEVRPSTASDIMSKMKSLRTSFVAELNKIKQSKKSGAGSGQIYKPTLWYFEKLRFLTEHVLPRRGTCNAEVNLVPDSDDIVTDESQSQTISPDFNFEDFSVVEECLVPEDSNEHLEPVNIVSISPSITGTLSSTPSTSGATAKKRKRDRDTTVQESEILDKAHNILENVRKSKEVKNDLDILGELVSATLKSVKNKKLVLKAKRQIYDVLFSVQEEDLQETENV